MRKKRPSGFTLVEVLIVVVIMAVLAATIIPQFTSSAKDAKESSVKYNLNVLRSQISLYRTQHDGNFPGADLSELTIATDVAGAAGSDFGPYVQDIPVNPFANSNTVSAPAAVPPAATVDGAGWLYDAASGQVWINHADYLSE